MAFLDKTGLQTLTNKLVQGDAIKVASHRGKNVKEVIDNIQRECENVALPNTMTLENRINEFKVGQGRDVDVSGDVEEGKVEIELEGRTYQNLLKENTLFTKAGGKEKKKIVHSVEQAEFRTISTGSMVFLKEAILKDNTIYTIIAQIKSSVKEAFGFSFKNNANYTQGHVYWHLPVLNEYCYKRMVLQTTTNCTHLVLGSHNSNLAKGTVLGVKNVILLEGDHSQTPIEEIVKYFEGIKSSFEDGVIDVEVQGKNLWNNDNIYEASYTSWMPRIDFDSAQKITGYQYVATNTSRGIATIIKVNPDTYYTVDIPSIKTDNRIGIALNKKIEQINKPNTHCIKHYPDIASNSYTFKTPQVECYMVIGLFGDYAPLQNGNVLVEGFRNMQVTQLKIVTSYEPYYKKKILFNIGEPLRSLPNGACDEIRNNNGQ